MGAQDIHTRYWLNTGISRGVAMNVEFIRKHKVFEVYEEAIRVRGLI